MIENAEGIFTSQEVYENCKRLIEALKVHDAAYQESIKAAQSMIVSEGRNAVYKNQNTSPDGAIVQPRETHRRGVAKRKNRVLDGGRGFVARFVWPLRSSSFVELVPTGGAR